MKRNQSQEAGSRNAYVYLANNGPTLGKELPNYPNPNDRQAGVQKFDLGSASSGSGASQSGGGVQNHAYYIKDKHTPESVVKTWVAGNQSVVEQVSGFALIKRCSDRFRDALKEQIEWDPANPSGKTGEKTLRDCPLCGEEDIVYHAHLLECDAQ